MARPRQRNLVARLADAGEEAIQRLSDKPRADRLMGAMNSMRERMDDMQKRMRGLDALERRLVAVERRLDKLEETSSSPTRRVSATTAKRSTSSKSGTRKTDPAPDSEADSTSSPRETGET
jgi:hypothetical protein